VKNDTQCAEVGEFSPDELYLALNDGAGDVALTTGGGVPANVSGLTGLMVNHSYADMSFPSSCSIYGEGHQEVTVGEIGLFTLVARSACGRQVSHGNEPWNVTMELADDAGATVNTIVPEMVDSNDGNYHFYYLPTAHCGAYTTSLTFGGELVTTLATTIKPAATTAGGTYVVGGPMASVPFGTPQSMMIQTADAFDCLTDDMADMPKLHVGITGPYTVGVELTAMGGGVYLAAWVFNAFGQYRFNVTFEGGVVKDGSFCLDVTAGSGAAVSGGAPVIVEEDVPNAATDLDLHMPTNGVTLEIWAELTSLNQPAYLIHKGAADQVGDFIKGYALTLLPGFQLEASFYAGRGELRKATADIAALAALNAWNHYAATYDGTTVAVYLNGALVGSETFAAPKAVPVNFYYHPLALGLGVRGTIDEAKLWKVARSAEDILDAMYCPPFGRMEELVGYFGFNEGDSAVETRGYSAACPPQPSARAAGTVECLTGTGITFSASTALTTAGAQGIGRPSAKYSVMNDVPEAATALGNAPAFTVSARDKCNYCYTGGSPSAFTAQLTQVNYEYTPALAPGEEYPQTQVVAALNPLEARPTPGFCPLWGSSEDGDAAEGAEAKGDVYDVVLNNANTAGDYLLGVFADGVAFEEPRKIKVIAAGQNTFEPHFVSQQVRFPTAGVPFAYYMTIQDSLNNVLTRPVAFNGQVSIVNKPFQMSYTLGENDISFNEEDGVYTLTLTLGIAGTYLIEVSESSMVTFTATIDCAAPAWKEVRTLDAKAPEAVSRFEHAAVEHEGDLFVFGGASHDKTYLNDVWKLNSVDDATFSYMTTVPLAFPEGYKEAAEAMEGEEQGGSMYQWLLAGGDEGNMPAPAMGSRDRATVSVTLDTAALIQNGQLNRKCMDIAFGERLFDFYMEPSPGCNSAATVFKVKLPAGFAEDSLPIYHGGSPQMLENLAQNPEAVFMLFEGFEHEEAVLAPVPPCDREEAAEDFFETTEELPYAGHKSLSMKADARGALAFRLEEGAAPVTEFTLSAWFWDSGASVGSHFMSPNYPECDTTGNVTLLGAAAAVGVYSLADGGNYCVGQPWDATEAARTSTWHHLEIKSDGFASYTSVDGALVKTEAAPIALDKVLLSSGYGVRGKVFPGLEASASFWDDVTVELTSNITAGAPSAPKAVAWDLRRWEKVETVGAPPPPRYSHSSVYHEGKVWLFGGERSAYSFNDMWTFDLEAREWAPVDLGLPLGATDAAVPSSRFDHTAVKVTHAGEDYMVVYGGRSGHVFLGDMWAFHFATATWTRLAESGELAPGLRFGHAASWTAATGAMYLFGGYTDAGFSADLFRCELGEGLSVTCADLTNGCPAVPGSTGVPAALTARYSHTMYSKPTDETLFVYGGSNLDSSAGFGQVWRYSGDAVCSWEAMGAADELHRYEQVMVVSEGSTHIVVQGGHQDGITGSTYAFPIG